jgi:polyhydroxyalkanoate synthesis regulator phasin
MTTDELDRRTLSEMNRLTQAVIDGELRGPEAKERLRELMQQVRVERARIQAAKSRGLEGAEDMRALCEALVAGKAAWEAAEEEA